MVWVRFEDLEGAEVKKVGFAKENHPLANVIRILKSKETHPLIPIILIGQQTDF